MKGLTGVARDVEPPPIAAVARLVALLLRASVVLAPPMYCSFESSLFDFAVDEAAAKINEFYYCFLAVCDFEGDQGP